MAFPHKNVHFSRGGKWPSLRLVQDIGKDLRALHGIF
jgi:hypothetical protein